MKKVWAQKQSGFTIVELLIVIVVIAILAAITLVSFNSIQSQAKNAAFLSAMDAYDKAIRLYYAEHGTYPSSELNGSLEQTCLGEDFIETADFEEDRCFSREVVDDYTGANKATVGKVIPSVNDALKRYINPLPAVADTKFSIADLVYSRGIGYQGGPMGPAQFASLYYYIDGNQKCGRGERTLNTYEGKTFTLCNVVFNTIN